MDPCDGSRRARHRDRSDHRHHHHHHHPSFSSTLLDAIYRSIDGDCPPDHPMVLYADTARAKQGEPAAGFRRDFLIEKWVAAEEEEEKKKKKKKKKKKDGSDEREAAHRGSRVGEWNRSMVLTNSSSSSSDSSSRSGGGFSSSESESRSRNSTSCYSVRRLKPKPAPTRTSVSDRATTAFDRGNVDPRKSHHPAQSQRSSSNKHEGLGFVKTKSKALKIYGDLKKANGKLKQPISPGARLASFLNSIFTVGSPKKAKIVASSVDGDQSACTSASSFSRSCLSNTPSSRSKPTSVVSGVGGPKQRSVRFQSVISVIVDEPGRQSKDLKMVAEISPVKAEFNSKPGVGNDKRRIAEAAREMLRSYQKKKESYEARGDGDDEDGGGGDADDAASCSSSDLFELDHLASIGCDQMRYREELPVYETTNLDTNRAIAGGLVL